MKIVFIDKKNVVIKVENKTLKVDSQKIPLRLIDTIILANAIVLNSRDLVKITKEGIFILLLSAKGRDMAIVQGARSKNPLVKLAQYGATQDKSLVFAQYFVETKIKKHREHLKLHGLEVDITEVLEKVSASTSIESLLGIEGSFSRLYFGHYFSLFSKRLHKGKRSRNPPLDPVNATMSFFYMVVYNLISVRLIACGFEPSMGFLHKPFRTHNALSSDFMEIFRADINDFVYKMFNEELLVSADFSKQDGVYLKYEARKKVWVEFKILMQNIEGELEREIVKLKDKIDA